MEQELKKIGGTFFVLYVIEKPFEIPKESALAHAFTGLFVSCIVYGACMYAKTNPTLVNEFLLYSF